MNPSTVRFDFLKHEDQTVVLACQSTSLLRDKRNEY